VLNQLLLKEGLCFRLALKISPTAPFAQLWPCDALIDFVADLCFGKFRFRFSHIPKGKMSENARIFRFMRVARNQRASRSQIAVHIVTGLKCEQCDLSHADTH